MFRVDGVPQFNEHDIDEYERSWAFHCSMVSTCSPVFDDLFDNYDVEDRLRKAKVLYKNNKTDTETCEFWAYFSSAKSARSFLARLNRYLRERARRFKDARAF